MTIEKPGTRKFDWRFPLRLWRLRHRLGPGWEGRLSLVLALAGVLLGIATYAALKSMPPFGSNADMVIWLLNLDLVVLLLLGLVVARRVAGLLTLWKRGIPGSKIHMRFVYIFGLVAMAPAVIMMVFSLFFFHYGVQAWFSDRVRTAVGESREVAEAYLKEHHGIIRADILAMANDLNREAAKYYSDPIGFEKYVRAQSLIRNLPDVVLFDDDGRIMVRTKMYDDYAIGDIPFFARERAQRGEVMILTDNEDEKVRALIRLQNLPSAFLLVGRPVDAKVLDHLTATREAVERYEEVAARYSGLRLTVTLIYSVVALVLLLAAMWFGLSFARRFASPIAQLIETSDRVGKGDLRVQASENSGLEEFDYLGKSFNRMTSQLSRQRDDLLDANTELESRRRFTETILTGVTSGIIGVTRNGIVTICNSSAAEFLHMPAEALIGASIFTILPEAREFLDQSYRKPDDIHHFEYPFLRKDGMRRIFLIHVAIELIDEADQGAVITFDDITELQSAQRKAAWSDVARRIAHEIKNPLTPIQLSAERLKRKYLKTFPEEDQIVFAQCIDTIIRHVGDIGHMVGEFSSFARMPEPVMKNHDVERLVRELVALNREASHRIDIALYSEEGQSFEAVCDGQQIRQAFTNILKNAMESVDARMNEDSGRLGRIAVAIAWDQKRENMIVTVSDNGIGLPRERDPQSLTEPYVTLREKGTGLGLAIVKKIMEDHGGHIIFGRQESVAPANWPELDGATVILTFPARQDHGHEITRNDAA